MERKIWDSFKTGIPAILSDSDIADHISNYLKWTKPLSAAVKGSLKLLADGLNESCIYSSKDNPEFLVDCVICGGRVSLNLKDFGDTSEPKKTVSIPAGEISYAVEWEWDPGREAVHFATRDVPKLKYINAARKVIIYSRVNDPGDPSRLVLEKVLKAMALGGHNLIIIEFERNDRYDRKSGNRLVMNLICSESFRVLESVNIFPVQ